MAKEEIELFPASLNLISNKGNTNMNRFERISFFSFLCVPKTREVFRLNYFIASNINLLSQLLVPTEVTD